MNTSRLRGMLADDLTGAMDAGMQLLSTGVSVHVALTQQSRLEGLPLDAWVVINTNSRNIAAEDAKVAVTDAYDLMRRRAVRLSYKKIDSTLRGNLGAELSALLSRGVKGFFIAPALPASGRTTLDGIHYVNGHRLTEDELSKDPFAPVQHDRILSQIAVQSDDSASHVMLQQLRGQDAESLLYAICDLHSPLVAFDAQTDQDMERIARLCALDEAMVPCGSAGLIAALSRPIAKPSMLSAGDGRPMLILCGSPARVSKGQLDVAAGQHSKLLLLRADPASMDPAERETLVQQVLAGLRAGRHVALDVAADGKEAFSQGIDAQTLERHRLAVQGLLNDAASLAMADALAGAMMIIGGDSAAGILGTLHTTHLELLGTAQPLMPFARCVDGLARGSMLITKAGGFGEPEAISRILEAFEG